MDVMVNQIAGGAAEVVERPSLPLLNDILAESAERHKHLCPRQVLGARIGLRGLRALGLLDQPYQTRFVNGRKRLLTIVETDGCGLDGVAVAVDCHVGRRTLRLQDYGKVAATFIDTRTGQAVRVWPSPQARERAETAVPQARSRWHAHLEAYQTLPDAALLCVQPVQLTHTIAQILSRPGVRVNCEACGEEIINEREVWENGRILCQSCANGGYYVPLA